MGRILAIDYGAVRTGMARTDVLQISINPLPTIPTTIIKEELEKFLMEGEVSDVVFGYPTHKDGTPTNVAKDIDLLIDKSSLKFPNIQFHRIDESFTSVKAREMMLFLGTRKKKRREKGTVDKVSAVLILKDFLDKR